MKQKKISSYLLYNIVSLSKVAGKTESFSGKISWTWTCGQRSRKFSYWENLLLFWIMLNKASAHLYALGKNIYTRKNSLTSIYQFIMNNSNTKKRCEICSKITIKTPEQRSTVFILNFEDVSHLKASFSHLLRAVAVRNTLFEK